MQHNDDRVKNIVGKGENVGDHACISPYPIMFSKGPFYAKLTLYQTTF